mmetsp:Transcript_39725/g.122820  ORF Transcript_39725/g.122820 Transcript_39725/m.122820 type:complete len:234 (-) Transcript_39725:17-718(-)
MWSRRKALQSKRQLENSFDDARLRLRVGGEVLPVRDPHRHPPERRRRVQVHHGVLDHHHRLTRLRLGVLGEALVRALLGLVVHLTRRGRRPLVAAVVHARAEEVGDAERDQHVVGVLARAVGHDPHLPPGGRSALEHHAQLRARSEFREVEVVHELEVPLEVGLAVVDLEPARGEAVLLVVLVAQRHGRLGRQLERLLEPLVDALAHVAAEARFVEAVQRVVEVEHKLPHLTQ